MWNDWQFYLNGILLGVGLAMDACAVSMANGLNEPNMKVNKTTLVAAAFGFFQALMPMIGWVCVHYIAAQFAVVYKIVPYIALALLGFIGGKMLYEGFKHGKRENTEKCASATATEQTGTIQAVATVQTDTSTPNAEQTRKPLTLWLLFTQAIATSIDALSVGFTISHYNAMEAFVTACVIAVITFGISFGAVFVGKKFGTKLGNKAEILGGFILIAIGLEIFIASFF